MAQGEADPARPDDVRRILGEILEWKVDAIVASGATLAELEVAAAWAAGADDVMGDARAPLSGRAAMVYDLIAAGEEFAVGEDEGAAPSRWG